MNAFDELLSFQKELGVEHFYIDQISSRQIPFMSGERIAVSLILTNSDRPEDPIFLESINGWEGDYIFFTVYSETKLNQETEKYKADRWTFGTNSGFVFFYDPKSAPETIKTRGRLRE